MDNPYTSDTLHHFVGYAHPTDHQKNFDVLTKILSAGWVSHPPHENNHGTVSYAMNWEGSLLTENLIIPTVTCFAEIPYQSLGIHIKKYGAFGLSFWRDHLFMFGGRPVMYIPTGPIDGILSIHGTALLKDVDLAYKGFNEHVISKHDSSEDELVRKPRSVGKMPTDERSAVQAMDSVFTRHFLAFIKPFYSEYANDHPKNYYMEREWRKFGNLEFKPVDVVKVFVGKGFKSNLEQEFPDYVGRIEEI